MTGDRASWLHGPDVPCTLTHGVPARAWRLVLLGAPGIGKGTQAELLSDRLHACHLSTGDVFRAAKCSCHALSPAMQSAMGNMQRGELVPDDTVIAMVAERAKCVGCRFGFLLDGYPRTVEQARALDALMAGLGVEFDAVLSYELETTKVVERLSGRRTCKGCKRTYHLASNPPSTAGVCDKCGEALYQREDDRPEAIAVRLDAYRRSTLPLAEYYEREGLLHVIDADGTPEEIYGRSMKVLVN